MTVTIAQQTIPNYQRPGTTAELRIYASSNFFQGGPEIVGGRGYFYKSVQCTVAGGSVNIPEFELESTTDSTIDTAKYVAVLFDDRGTEVAALMEGMEFSVPPIPAATTWQNIAIYNRAIRRRMPDTYYTANQVNALLGPFLDDLEVLQSSFKILALDYGNSLSAAIAAIGETPTVLIVGEDTTVTTPLVVPATLMLEQRNGAQISFSGTGSLNFLGRGIRGDEVGFFRIDPIGPYSGRPYPSTANAATDIIPITEAPDWATGTLVQVNNGVWDIANKGAIHELPGGVTNEGIYYAIRVTANSIKLATSYEDALAGVAVDLTSDGDPLTYYTQTRIAWTGDDAPEEVLSEIVDTDDNSSSNRIQILDFAFSGRSVLIKVHPRAITTSVQLRDKHSILLLPGVLENDWNGFTMLPEGAAFSFYPYREPFSLGSNAEFTSVPGAIFMESSVNGVGALVSIRHFAENSNIHHNYFLGQGQVFDGSDSGVSIFGGRNNHIHHNVFDNVWSYAVAIVPQKPGVDDPIYCSAHHNELRRILTQAMFIGGGRHIDFSDNKVDNKGFVSTTGVSFSFFDVEPNSGATVLEDINIERNTFDFRGANYLGGSQLAFVRVNPAGVDIVRRIKIKDNEFIGTDDDGSTPIQNQGGIEGVGMDDFEISGNRAYGLANVWPFITTNRSRRGKIFNNTSHGGSGTIWLQSTADTDVHGNRHRPDQNSGADLYEISESFFQDQEHIGVSFLPYSSTPAADSAALFFATFEGGTLFKHFPGLTFHINDLPYVLESIETGAPGSSIPDHSVATFTAPLASLPAQVMNIPDTDIDLATDTFTYTGHGYVTGAAIAYINIAGGSLGNVPYAGCFAIRVDADHFKLASSYENALNGIAIDVTSKSATIHPFYPAMALFSQNNTIYDNGGATYNPIAAHSNSTISDIAPFKGATSAAASSMRFHEDTDNGANYVDLFAPASVIANRTLTLPDETGTLATQGYANSLVTGLLDLKGSTDCSANPDYPAASKGDTYVVSAAGKIGGAAGKSVDIGDVYIASSDNAGGAEGAVGNSWFVVEHNLAGALLAANNLSDVADAVAARANLGAPPVNLVGSPCELGVAVSDETTDLTTGTAKLTFRMPFAMTLTEIRASVNTAPAGSTIIVDINDGGSTIMAVSKLSIDDGERTSTTAATPAAITDAALADDAEVTVDIDQVGSTTPGKGLKVWLIGTRA